MADHFRLRHAIESADDRRAAGGLQHRAQNPQRRRLAGPVRPQQAVNLARGGREGYLRKREHFAAHEIGIRLREGPDIDHRPRISARDASSRNTPERPSRR